MKTPTPGALRAARWIEQQHFDGVCLGPVAVQQIAQEIDSDTGLPELVEALAEIVDQGDPMVGLHQCSVINMSAIDRARAVLDRYHQSKSFVD